MWKACRPLCFHNQTALKILGVFFWQKKINKNAAALCHNQLISQIKSFIEVNLKEKQTLSQDWYSVASKCLRSSLPTCPQNVSCVLELFPRQARHSGKEMRSLCQRARGGWYRFASPERHPFTLRVTSSPFSPMLPGDNSRGHGENMETARKSPWSRKDLNRRRC